MSTTPCSSEERPVAHPVPQRPNIPPALLSHPPSPMSLSTAQGAPAAAHPQPGPPPCSQQPPTPAASPVRSQLDRRWRQGVPSTVPYCAQDNTSSDATERHRTPSFYWQQSYMNTHLEISRAMETVEIRLGDLERRLDSAESAFMVCLFCPRSI